ncbi:MAG: ABC transporter ATP-binding protein, partial [Firmicutes bacterium]|nr:ABC transporter ATP-binding protein [Bacillota bacterium]
MSGESLLSVENLKKHFPVGGAMLGEKQLLKAVDGISFNIHAGETFGIVGESGCGKSTLGRVILHLLEPTSGKIYFKGSDISSLNRENLRKLRKDMQIIFQDPYASLNGRMTVSRIIREPLIIHGQGTRKEQEQRALQLLEVVGLNASHAGKYPHEFSGGQRQR